MIIYVVLHYNELSYQYIFLIISEIFPTHYYGYKQLLFIITNYPLTSLNYISLLSFDILQVSYESIVISQLNIY